MHQLCTEREMSCSWNYLRCDIVVRMKEVFASAEDTEIDVPRIWQYLAEVIGPMIKVDGALPLNFFDRATESIRLSRKVSHLIADVLQCAASQLVRHILQLICSDSVASASNIIL